MDSEEPIPPETSKDESCWSKWCCWVVVGLLVAIVFGARYQADLYDPVLSEQYDILGLPSDASLDMVRKRYRKLVLSLHPDKCPEESCHKRFMHVKDAYLAITGRDDTFDILTKEHYGAMANHVMRKRERERARRAARERL